MSLRRPLAVVALSAASVVALTGCGVTGTGFQPGQATSINGETISVAEVDDVASSVCAVLVSDPRFEGQVISGSSLRGAAERGLALQVMADQLADDFDLAVDPGNAADTAEQYRLSYGSADPDDLAAAEPAFVAEQRFSDVLIALGTQEAGADAGQEAIIAAGVAKVQSWTEDSDIETNPAFDAIEVGEDQILTVRDDLSVPVTDQALDASATQAPEGYAASLPESQRCGS